MVSPAQQVAAVAAVQRVIAAPGIHRVVAAPAKDVVTAKGPGLSVVFKQVLPIPLMYRISAVPALHTVAARPSADAIVLTAAAQGVIAVTPEDCISANIAIDHIIGRVANNAVIAAATNCVFDDGVACDTQIAEQTVDVGKTLWTQVDVAV